MSEYLKILLPFFAGSIVLLVVIRVVASRLKRRALDEIRRKFAGRTIVRQSVGANYFGRSSAGLGQVRGNGVLVLTADELYFLMFAPHRELTIPLNTVTSVSTPRSHLGVPPGGVVPNDGAISGIVSIASTCGNGSSNFAGAGIYLAPASGISIPNEDGT